MHLFAVYRSVCILAAACLLAACFGPSVRAQSLPSCVMVVAPGLRAADLTGADMPTLSRLIAEGGSGWMVCRAARLTDGRLLRPDGRETTGSLLATIGSGARGAAPATSPPDIQARLGAVRAANASLDHSVPFGALGDLFRARSLKTASLGDADAPSPDSEAWYLACGSDGRVDFPMTRAGVAADAGAPFGIRTDVAGILAGFDGVRGRARLVVIACDDLDRADNYARLCRPSTAEEHRAAARRTLERLLAGLAARLGPPAPAGPLVLIFAPGPAASSEERADRLAPIVAWGGGEAHGLLYTPSTRRPGLVLSTDILATVAGRLGLRVPAGATGRAFRALPAEGGAAGPSPWSARGLAQAYAEWMRVARQQDSPGALPSLHLLLVLTGTAMLALSRRARAGLGVRLRRGAAALACAGAALPLAMLILPLLHPRSPLLACLLLACTEFAIGVAVACGGGALRFFKSTCALTLLILLGDLLTGTHLLESAWMSYSVVEGARFYGIGNEYMGVVIGAACALFGILGPVPPRKERGGFPAAGFAALFAALTVAMGVGGAKVGAIPSAGAAFVVTLLVWKQGRLRVSSAAAGLALLAAALALLAILDSRHAAGDQTHLIRALTGSGGGSIAEIARRKLSLEGWLLLHSSWTPALLAAALSLAWVARHTEPALFRTPRAAAGVSGLAAGAIASILCNDSGLTSAALILVLGWAWATIEAAAESLGTKPRATSPPRLP